MIYCPKCEVDKDESEFNANKGRKNGKQLWCRVCTTAYSKKWYSENTEKHNDYVGEHRIRKNHTCKHCGKSSPEVKFHTRKVEGRTYPYFICVECKAVYRKKYPTSEDAKQRGLKKKAAKSKVDRADPRKRAKYIVEDSKDSDKKKGLDNDLDLGFVSSEISNPCSYCDSVGEKMTLDRLDNNLGHLKTNVKACCVQCNYFRRNMPYEAWVLLIPGMQEARRRGLLDGWTFGTRKSHNTDADLDALAVLKEL